MNIVRHLINFAKVNWIKTIICNFKYLDFNTAIKLPIFVYQTCHFYGKGEIIISSNKVIPGMIKIGIKHEASCISRIGIIIQNEGKIIIKSSGIIGNGSSIVTSSNGIIYLGRNFGITGNFSIHCHSNIVIGDNFSCSWNVNISDTDHHQCYNPETLEKIPITKPVNIGNNVWCCQHSTISKGSDIPNWTTIAQMSLTNKVYNIPEFSIVGGIPAKNINKKIIREDLSQINKLPSDWFITQGLTLFNKRY